MPAMTDPLLPTRWELCSQQDPPRLELESYVKTHFAKHWDAEINGFMPWLAGMRNDQGGLMGVLGLRPAECGPLFLEHYLDQPIEQQLATVSGHPIQRQHLVEVGNLASSTPGGARWLIVALTAYLQMTGREWVVFTGGPGLRNAFRRLGLSTLHELAPADPARIGPTVAQWGRYYQQKPRVMAGRIDEGFLKLDSLFTEGCPWRVLWDAAKRAAVPEGVSR